MRGGRCWRIYDPMYDLNGDADTVPDQSLVYFGARIEGYRVRGVTGTGLGDTTKQDHMLRFEKPGRPCS